MTLAPPFGSSSPGSRLVSTPSTKLQLYSPLDRAATSGRPLNPQGKLCVEGLLLRLEPVSHFGSLSFRRGPSVWALRRGPERTNASPPATEGLPSIFPSTFSHGLPPLELNGLDVRDDAFARFSPLFSLETSPKFSCWTAAV